MFQRIERHTVSEFRRRPHEIIGRLVETGAPILLTRRGKPAVVLQDREAFERMLAELADLEERRISTLIAEGIAAAERGDLGIPLEEVAQHIRREVRERQARNST